MDEERTVFKVQYKTPGSDTWADLATHRQIDDVRRTVSSALKEDFAEFAREDGLSSEYRVVKIAV